MAIGASIFKVKLTLSNFNSHYYEDFNLTMAKHPSESESRMLYRLAIFCICAHQDLSFTKGLSTQEEPELWQKDLTGKILHWIELGQPDDKRIRQAIGVSKKVSLFTTHESTYMNWFNKVQDKVPHENVDIFFLNAFENGPIEKIIQRSMNLVATIEDDILYLGDDSQRVGLKFLKIN